ncbi:MAG TPA: phosphoribosylglycinamide formyltransferase [Candidatus Acidoferrales bacterium]|nr:phosphoribosylglycinamide formyltransferase [Candidatus Acidoferrales bacterium]
MGVGVLVSGTGTNLRAILEACTGDGFPARVVGVGANRPSCPALEIARVAQVPSRSFPAATFSGDLEARDQAIASWLLGEGASILALAGYDRVLTKSLLRAFPGRVLNLHNSLLPAFAGTMNAVQEALDHGVKLTGCTVHLVDEDYLDGGPIVLQAAVPVEEGDTTETLRQRIHEQEWRIFPQAIALLARGQLRVEGRRVLQTGPGS